MYEIVKCVLPCQQEAQRKLEEYREMATTLIHWIREHTSIMRDRHFPSNTIELKRMAQESTRSGK